MRPQNAEEIKKVEDIVNMLDYLLQQGVVFTRGEVEQLDNLIEQLDKIVNSIKTFNVR